MTSPARKQAKKGSGGRLTKRKNDRKNKDKVRYDLKHSTSSTPATIIAPSVVLSSPAKDDLIHRTRAAVFELLETIFEEGKDKELFLQSMVDDLRSCNDSVSGTAKSTPVVASNSHLNVVTNATNACPSSDGRAVATKLQLPVPVSLNKGAFNTPSRLDSSSNRFKNRKIDILEKTMLSIGNDEQQLLVVFDYLKNRKSSSSLGQAISNYLTCGETELTNSGIDIISNIKEIMQLANHLNTNNQCKSLNNFQRSVMMAICPSVMPSDKKKAVTSLVKCLGLTTFRAKRFMELGVGDRQAAAGGDKSVFAPVYNRNQKRRYTKDIIARLHYWLYNHCGCVVVSPHSKDTKLVADVYTGVKSKQQKYFYTEGVAQVLLEAAKAAGQ